MGPELQSTETESQARWVELYLQNADRILREVAGKMDLTTDEVEGAHGGVYQKLNTYFTNGHDFNEETFTGLVAQTARTYFLDQLKRRKRGMGHLTREEPSADEGGDTRGIEDTVVDQEASHVDSLAQINMFYESLTTQQRQIVDLMSDGATDRAILRQMPDLSNNDLAAERQVIEDQARAAGLVPAEEEMEEMAA